MADYRDVDPKIGTLEDFDVMMDACNKADIKVMVDIVPNHCSDDHVWFQEALKAPKGSAARDKFIFRDGQSHSTLHRNAIVFPLSFQDDVLDEQWLG